MDYHSITKLIDFETNTNRREQYLSVSTCYFALFKANIDVLRLFLYRQEKKRKKRKDTTFSKKEPLVYSSNIAKLCYEVCSSIVCIPCSIFVSNLRGNIGKLFQLHGGSQ